MNLPFCDLKLKLTFGRKYFTVQKIHHCGKKNFFSPQEKVLVSVVSTYCHRPHDHEGRDASSCAWPQNSIFIIRNSKKHQDAR